MSTRHEKERQRAAQEKYQAVLSQLLKDEDNKYCVDCDAKGPRWASWNLGIFLCIRCAGIHRNLGVHISKVKSVNLDTWTAEQLAMLMEMGNSRARAVYEANVPDNFRRPQTDPGALEAFIRAKYEHKRYIAREWVQPKPTIPKQVKKELLDDDKHDKKKSRVRPSSMITLNAPSSQKTESKETETNQSLKEVAKESKKSSHADDLLNLSSPGESSVHNNTNLLDDFLGGIPTAGVTLTVGTAAPLSAQGQNNGQTTTTNTSSSQQAFQQNGAFDDSLFTGASSDTKSGGDKTTKESIMALYGSSTPQQQGIFGVPVANQIAGGQYTPFIGGHQVQGMVGMAPHGSMYMIQQPTTDPITHYKLFTDTTTTPGGMYMPAQGMTVPGVSAGNPLGVQPGMPTMVSPAMMGIQQAGMYQMGATGMMSVTPGTNPMNAAPGLMMQQQQVGMYAVPQAQPQMNQMNMQQMQQHLAAIRLNSPAVIPPGGQMGVRPPVVGIPGTQASNPWGMQNASGQTLSTNLWQ